MGAKTDNHKLQTEATAIDFFYRFGKKYYKKFFIFTYRFYVQIQGNKMMVDRT